MSTKKCNKKVTERMVRHEIYKLGRTPKAIAKSLKKCGIKGVPRESNHCPLAVFLQKKFKRTDINVDFTITFGDYYGHNDLDFKISKVVDKFTDMVDEGKFPEICH